MDYSKKYARVEEDRLPKRHWRRLFTLLLFILLQPVLFVYFGFYLIYGYAAAIAVLGVFGILQTRKVQGFWQYPLGMVKQYLAYSASTLKVG